MALTISAPIKRFRGLGDHDGVLATVTFDSSYPTGGEVLGATEAAALGLNDIDVVIPQGTTADNTTSLAVEYVNATKALRLKTHATGTEVANASDQSARSVLCLFLGGGISDA